MAISTKLKKRWEAYSNLADILSITHDLSVSPFGLTEAGLQDFRGIKLIGERKNSISLSVSLKDSDFSGSLWQNFQISEHDDILVTIENVKFDGSTFNSEYYMAALFGRGTHFISCSFANCRYKNVDFIRAKIQDCQFTGIKKSVRLSFIFCKLIENSIFSGEMRKIDFTTSNIKNCVFEGTLYDCLFYGLRDSPENNKMPPPENVDNRMDNVDFSNAEVILCTFRFCYLDKVKPSQKNCLVRITNQFYQNLIELIEQESLENDEEELLRMASIFCEPYPLIPYGIYHKDDLRNLELSHQLYDFICRAAEKAHCRIT